MSGGDEWIDEWISSISVRTAKARQLSERVSALSVSASSSDGAIVVTVSSSGVPTDLRLSESVKAWPSQRIATEIMAVMRKAQSRLAAKVGEVAEQTAGANSPTVQALVDELKHRFPQPPPTTQSQAGYGRR